MHHFSSRLLSCRIILILWLLSWGVGKAWTQVLEVPIDVQVPLFLKATSYDRTFPSKLQKNGVLQIGVCYQDDYRVSVNELEALKEAFSKPVAGFKIQLVPMPIADKESLEGRKEWGTLTAVYITSMRGLNLNSLLEQTRKEKVMSVSTDPKLSSKGVSMSFSLVGSRPKFVIHRQNSIDEGCEFSSQLLKLATVY